MHRTRPSRPLSSPPPEPLRVGLGLRISEDCLRDRWIWQHPEWPCFTFHWDPLVEPVAAAHHALGRLQGSARLLAPDASREVLAEALALEGVSTSAIEGEHIHPASMAASIARHLGLPPKGDAPFDRKSEGMAAILMDALRNPGVPLTLERLCRWHESLFPESRPDLTIGALRPGPVHVGTRISEEETLVHFLAVPRDRLEAELTRFLDWFNRAPVQNGLVRAGIAHLWFVTLHPFDDGNGRLARALTDLALAQDRDIDPIVRMSHRILQIRPDYYTALERAQSFTQGLDLTPWLQWFIHQVAEACPHPQDIIRRTLAKGAFWARHKDAPLNARQCKILNRLLDAGPDGFEGGMTTRKAASLTGCSPISASRDLSGLAALGCLRPLGAGRSTRYVLTWDTLLRDEAPQDPLRS